jgi:hypothetical protein
MATSFKLEVPLDASGVQGFKPEQAVKVLAVDSKGATQEQTVKLDAKGTGSANFSFAGHPGALHIVAGPENATAAELRHLQTLAADVPVAQWTGRTELKLSAIAITSFYWAWWLRWCQTFTIRGRVLCADGSPVPGATVCAYDVDWWWWWFSEDLVGCAVTDGTGSFEISFRWCCGWWPWWWWRLRHWLLEVNLAERILAVIDKDPRLPKLPVPTPKPDLAIFNQFLTRPPRGPIGPGPGPILTSAIHPTATRPLPGVVDPGQLAGLREKLLSAIPAAAELERLRIWPWYQWEPWWDCNPDIIFRATQNCNGADQVIVSETIFNTRFDIPTTLDVNLTANASACCVRTPPNQPPGNCVLLSGVCSDTNAVDLISNIGGNIGAAPAPIGYQNPGKVAADGDRPYAGTLNLFGQFGAGATADYYEVEYSDDNGVNWHSLPPGTVAAPARYYFGPPLFGEPVFPPIRPTPSTQQTIAGRTFIETRTHFEANHGAGTWGFTHFWVSDWMEMADWITSSTSFADGTYRLRVRNWTAAEVAGGANIMGNTPLDICDPETAGADKQNHVYITLDNRLDPDPSHPSGDHPCGAGTVHTCTREPDTRFISVKLLHGDGTSDDLAACSQHPMRAGDQLQVDFFVHDPDGHLSYFELYATYGDSLTTPVLGAPGSTLIAGPAPYVNAFINIPAALQRGPDYGQALGQGAVSPIWSGGTFRITVPAATVFPEPCCYQLVLYGHKRTLTCGDESLWLHTNLSEYSFMITA